jgi:hypothetical protein
VIEMAQGFPSPRLASAGVTLVFVVLALVTILSGRAIQPALLVALSPLPFYLFAIWSARVAIVRIGKGDALRSLISPMLGRIGWALFLGGLVQVFLVPWLRPGKTLVARLVSDAERDRAELDEIL